MRIEPRDRGVRIYTAGRRVVSPPSRMDPVAVGLDIEVRSSEEGVVVVRASNDEIRDSFGTVITVEALHDWAEGFLENRTVNLQHDLSELRGIKGRPFVGVATRVDFTPQLEAEVRVFDPDVRAMIADGTIRGGSIEFVPIEDAVEAGVSAGRPALIYHRVSSAPEATGLALTDEPSVPGADVVAYRAADRLDPNWQYAVVDPLVLNGEIRDPAQIRALRWFPHHDPRTRYVDEGRALREFRRLNAGAFEVPEFASLSRREIEERAEAHFHRHFVSKVGLPGVGYSAPFGN